MAAMRIVDVSTTEFHAPDLPGIQDATIRHRTPGRAIVFVHVTWSTSAPPSRATVSGARNSRSPQRGLVVALPRPLRPRPHGRPGGDTPVRRL